MTPPTQETIERVLKYIRKHPGALLNVVRRDCRISYTQSRSILTTLRRENKIYAKPDDFGRNHWFVCK